MNPEKSFNYPVVGIEQLLRRQLADWLQFLSELETAKASEKDLAYCRGQVERLQKELIKLQNEQT